MPDPKKQIIGLPPASQVKDADIMLKRDLDSQTDEFVTVEQLNDHTFGSSRTLSGDFDVQGDIVVSGNSEIQGNQTVSGDIDVLGDSNYQGNSTVSGDFLVGGNIKRTAQVITEAYTAKNGDVLLADSSGGSFIITLPSNLPILSQIEIYDPSASWFANNITVDGDGVDIDDDSTLTLDENGDSVRLIRTASQWRAY